MNLLEIIMDLGRKPSARFLGTRCDEVLRDELITEGDLRAAMDKLGDFGGDNRAGIAGTLHRISAIRNRNGGVVGLTCRVGRAVTGHVEMIRDILEGEKSSSLLLLGKPGVGKTTVIREIARVLADDMHRRVVIVDTSNEIGGDGDIPHAAIGGARRMQVPDPSRQHHVMVEAVENHMPEVVIIDEIGTEAEAMACRTIAERGVMLVGTAHGQVLENLMKNPTLSDLIGGIQTVTLSDEEARNRGTQKSVQERKAPPTFPIVIEMRERSKWVTHLVEESVDALLQGGQPYVQVRTRDSGDLSVETVLYDSANGDGEEGSTDEGARLPALSFRSRGNSTSSTDSIDFTDDWSETPGFMWAEKLRDITDNNITDKEALQKLAMKGYLGRNQNSGSGRRPPTREKYNIASTRNVSSEARQTPNPKRGRLFPKKDQ